MWLLYYRILTLFYISVVFFPIHKKALLRWLLHLSIHAKFQPIPSSGLLRRHDRPSTFFKWKIDHNSINLYRIPPKIGTEMHFSKPFMCIKFQLDWSMRLRFIGEMWNVQNEWRLRKNEEIISKFYSFVSRDWLPLFTSNLVCKFA